MCKIVFTVHYSDHRSITHQCLYSSLLLGISLEFAAIISCAHMALSNTYAQYTPPTPTRFNCQVASPRRRRCEQNSQLAHDDCRPTDSVDSLETDQTDSVAVWQRKFWSILITFSPMTSLCRHLTPTSAAQQYRKL